MIKNKLLFLILMNVVFLTGYAQNSAPTWSSDVQCIVYSHCSGCHNPNSIAPFSLLSYHDAQINMVSIKYYVSNKLMPPYLPNTSYQHYADMRNLTDQEIRTIVAWVDSGGRVGDTSQLMAPPVFVGGNVITNPDLTIRMPDYVVPQTGADLYRCFVLTAPMDSDRYIKTMEIIPGNKAAVHHVLVYQDASYTPVARDSADPGPGYTNFGGTGSNSSTLMGGWVPGSGVDSMPTGMAIKITAGSRIIIQVHYPVTAQGLLDSTRINIKYDTNPNLRSVLVFPMLNHQISLTDGPLVIPADSVRTFHEQAVISQDFTALSIAPHAHLVCTMMKAFGVTPTGDTIPLIDIPQWDFHWQGSHQFQHPIKFPAGTTLYGIATYNNTYNNPHAPQPLATVSLGEATTNEMMLFFFSLLPYQPGDENIIIDTASHQSHYMNCVSPYISSATTGIREASATDMVSIFPNPAQSMVNYRSTEEIVEITISDIAGKIIKQIDASGSEGQIFVSDLCNGLYLMHMKGKSGSAQTIRFIKE